MKRIIILLSLCLLFSFQAYGQGIVAKSAGGSPAVTETATTYTITKTNIVLAGSVTVSTISFTTLTATTSVTVGSDALNKNGIVAWVDAGGGTGNATIASDKLTFADFSGGVDIDGASTASSYTSDATVVALSTMSTGANSGTSGQINFIASDNDQGNLNITTGDIFNVDGFSGTGFGIAAPDGSSGSVHVWRATAGSVTAHTSLNSLIIEHSGTHGISILSTDAATGYLGFGSPGSNLGTLIGWTYSTGVFSIETVKASSSINLDPYGAGAGTTTIGVGGDSDLFVVIGNTTHNGTVNFAADSQGDDDYEIALPSISALVAGLTVTFTANTANTDGATLEITSVGDLDAILKMNDQTLATNDIEAGSVVTVVFDGSNWQMVSPVAN